MLPNVMISRLRWNNDITPSLCCPLLPFIHCNPISMVFTLLALNTHRGIFRMNIHDGAKSYRHTALSQTFLLFWYVKSIKWASRWMFFTYALCQTKTKSDGVTNYGCWPVFMFFYLFSVVPNVSLENLVNRQRYAMTHATPMDTFVVCRNTWYNHLEVLYKKEFLENLAKFIKKYLWRIFFFYKESVATFLIKKLQHSCLSVKVANFLRIPILWRSCEWLRLHSTKDILLDANVKLADKM